MVLGHFREVPLLYGGSLCTVAGRPGLVGHAIRLIIALWVLSCPPFKIRLFIV